MGKCTISKIAAILLLIIIISVLTTALAYGEDISIENLESEVKDSSYVIANSNDWTDIYSILLFSKIKGEKEAQFLISREHGLLVPSQLDANKGSALVLESLNDYIIKGFENNLESVGIVANQYEYRGRVNLELLKEYEFNNYIVVDDAYSYNSISVLPYAARAGYFVIFVGEEDTDSIIETLNEKQIDDLILYGYTSREVSSALKEIKPDLTIINEGSKYDNNLEMVKIFSENFETKQLILSNGDFFEPQFFTGENPVLFIGTTNTPEEVVDYIEENEIKYGTLIGNDLYTTAKALKDRTGMKIMVKFAKGINQEQFALDMYSLPVPTFNVIVENIDYNLITKELEITYQNTESYPAFAKADFEILLGDESLATLGDEESFFIERETSKTLVYDVDLSEHNGKQLLARISLVFGEDEKSMEFLTQADYNINFVEVTDSSDIEIEKVTYDKPTKRFVIDIRNTGEETSYVMPELIDVIVDGKEEMVAAEKSKRIEPGKSIEFQIKARLTDEDILDNEIVKVKAWYGVRSNALTKEKTEEFEMKVTYLSKDMIVIIGLVSASVIVVILIFVFVIGAKRKKKKYHHHSPPPKKH